MYLSLWYWFFGISMSIVKIITPVHIGTGDLIESPCFHRVNESDKWYRYSFSDLIGQLPTQVVLDERLLGELARYNVKKKMLYSAFEKYVKYDGMKPIYEVEYCGDNSDAKDIQEQIKTNGKPYIPGSSIKGALLHAWFYYEIKHNFNPGFIEKVLKKNRSINFLEFFGIDIKIDKGYSTFMKDLQSCIICHDIYFKNIELFKAIRVGSSSGRNLNLGIYESIQSGQEIQDNLFVIDYEKIKKLALQYLSTVDSNDKLISKLINEFDYGIFLKACNEYTIDVLGTESEKSCMDMYESYDCSGIIQFNNQLFEMLKEVENNKEKSCFLRIGNSTNYYNKSIALLIKKKAPSLFETYFDQVLSPKQWGKQKASSKTIPKTRVIFENDNLILPPGYIKVTYD